MSDSVDDWEAAGDMEFDDTPITETVTDGDIAADDGDEWLEKAPPLPVKALEPPFSSSSTGLTSSTPMIIVDLSVLSKGGIHNRNDRASNNDPVLCSTWKAKIESNYANYAMDAGMIIDKTVIPCSSCVFPAALQRLRNETPGQYYLPIFPPKN